MTPAFGNHLIHMHDSSFWQPSYSIFTCMTPAFGLTSLTTTWPLFCSWLLSSPPVPPGPSHLTTFPKQLTSLQPPFWALNHNVPSPNSQCNRPHAPDVQQLLQSPALTVAKQMSLAFLSMATSPSGPWCPMGPLTRPLQPHPQPHPPVGASPPPGMCGHTSPGMSLPGSAPANPVRQPRCTTTFTTHLSTCLVPHHRFSHLFIERHMVGH